MFQGLHVVEVLFVHGSYRFPIPGGSGWGNGHQPVKIDGSSRALFWVILPSEFLSSCHEYPWIGISTTKEVEYGQRLKALPLDSVRKTATFISFRPNVLALLTSCRQPLEFSDGHLQWAIDVHPRWQNPGENFASGKGREAHLSEYTVSPQIYILVVFVACDIIDLKSKLKEKISTR